MAAICNQAGPCAGQGSSAADFGPVLKAIATEFRALLWTLPPESHWTEFRTHGARLR